MQLRAAAPEDCSALLALIAEMAAHHGDTSAASAETLSRDVLSAQPWLPVIVAADQGRLIGYAALTPNVQLQLGLRSMDLHHLFVTATHRGKGHGRALLTAAIAHAKAAGCAYLTVGTAADNLAAQQFYQAQGFTPNPPSSRRFRFSFD